MLSSAFPEIKVITLFCTAHHTETSKVAVTEFHRHAKRGIYFLCSHNSTRLKLRLSWNSVRSRKMIIWSRNCPFFGRFGMKRERRPPPPTFNCVFTRYGNTKIHINDEKNLDCRSSFRYGWLQSHGQVRDHNTSVYFSTVFSRSGNLRSLNCKNIAQTNKRAKGFRQIHSFCYIENFRGLFKFRTLRSQLGKNTQNYSHAGRKRGRWSHFFIAVFQCPVYGWHLCQV